MLGVACLFTLILAVCYCLSCYPNPLESYTWSPQIKQITDIDSSHISCIEKLGSVLHLFNTIYSILFEAQALKKAENDIQMTLILILQAILPLITGFIVEHLRVKTVFVKKDRRV
uniref:Uncharacterized protein n=1 Tax=Ditylenchus dipsaci TaxID=166011 RepID=A0A915E9N2_9BILA